ncbi:MAG: hypothetical protein ACYTGZ_17110 [Planctomycetota bacterium]|jgi:hypothetical protein
MRPILLLVAAAALVACATPKELTPKQKAAAQAKVRDRLLRLPDELKLSQDQYHRTRPIVKEFRERVLRAIVDAKHKERSMSTLRALVKEVRTARMDAEKKCEPILSEEQMTALRKGLDDVRDIVKNAGKGP